MMVIAGRLPKHLAMETLWEVPSVLSPDHCQLLRHLDGRHPSLCCLFVRRCRQHVGHLVRPVCPGFCCSQPGHDAGGPPLLHLLFLAHCHRPPTLVHPLLRCLFVGWCHQHVVHLVHLVHHCFCCLQPSNDAGDPPLLHLLFLAHCRRPPDLAHPSPCRECWYCHPHALCPVPTGHHVLH
jgi:hypothetical protein